MNSKSVFGILNISKVRTVCIRALLEIFCGDRVTWSFLSLSKKWESLKAKKVGRISLECV